MDLISPRFPPFEGKQYHLTLQLPQFFLQNWEVLNYLLFKKFLISCLISPKSPQPGFSNLRKRPSETVFVIFRRPLSSNLENLVRAFRTHPTG